ncbi:wos2, partial [Fragariocoptes setiger]
MGRHPTVLWAQRASHLYVTITLEDCKNPTIKLDNNTLYFNGKSESLQSNADHGVHEVKIEFYKPVKPEEPTKYVIRDRGTEFVIYKEEEGWWPRLLKDSTKQHWLKSDFSKWKDEDDSDDESPAGLGGAGGGDFSELMRQMGGMSGGMPDLGDLDEGENGEQEDDSDDEGPPELE